MRLKSSLMLDVNDIIDDTDEQKNVKFADDYNSNLVEIRKFVPSSEKMDLWTTCDYFNGGSGEKNLQKPKTSFSLKDVTKNPELAICFKDPYLQPNFRERFSASNVILDRCGARDRIITGVVLVRNLALYKHVFGRYT